MTLAEFLDARITEDEEAANACIGRHWHSQAFSELRTIPQDDRRGAVKPYWHQIAVSGYDGGPGSVKSDYDERPTFAHIARWDPARVLAECEAKRQAVELHRKCGSGHGYCDDGGHGWDDGGCADLAYLALPYSSHPDYRSEWTL